MSLFAKNWLSAFAILVGAATPAAAGDYTCRLPRALLCDGCAQQIAISLQPGGGCRISFTPPPAAASPSAPASTGQLELQIQSAPITAAPRAPAYRPRRVVQAPRAPAHPCFTFNGAQYCE
jgi:hypothetical protein